MIQLGELNTVIQLEAHAQETTDTVGAAVAAPPSTVRALAIFDISAVGADADEVFTFQVEGRVVAGTGAWVNAHALGEPATLVALQPTGAQIAKVSLDVFAEYRSDLVVAGATPDVTYGVHVIAEVARRAAAAQVLG